MTLPLTKQFTCANKHRINLVPISNVMPINSISAANLDYLSDVCFGDELWNDIASYSNDSNIQVSIHPQTSEFYAVYHTSANEAYVVRVDKVPLNEDTPVAAVDAGAQSVSEAETIDMLRQSYIVGRLTLEDELNNEHAQLKHCKGNTTMEATARQRIKQASDRLRRLNDDIDNFEQEHGAL